MQSNEDNPPDIDYGAILTVFWAEAEEGLAAMESRLLELESQPDDADALAHIFRVVHTLKGNSGQFGLTAIESLSHTAEDLLGGLRSHSLAVTPQRIDLLLETVDALRDLLAKATSGGDELTREHEALLRRLRERGEAAPTASSALAEGAKSAAEPQARTLRVSVERLDQLLALTGEIAIARARMTQMLETPQLSRRSIHEVHRESEQRYLNLQELVMRLRMVAVGPTFHQYGRLVHDQARALGKEVRLSVVGGDVEVDNSVLQMLRDPLTHMIRNAIDHGIETPEARLAHGKERVGEIRLSARHETGAIVIELADDGAGLKRDRILARARGLGLWREERPPSDAQLFEFPFEPGFSTADAVSALSGRGVGLDVVRRNINSLRGTVSIASQAGHGATLTIRLPLTLSIIEGLLVGVAESCHVIPIEVVLESFALPGAQAGHEVRGIVDLRGQPLPFVRLSGMLGVPATRAAREILIVVRMAKGVMGLVVDRVLAHSQIVIKPLSKVFHGVRGLAGSTVLGSGQVALILDVEALLEAEVAGGAAEVASPAD